MDILTNKLSKKLNNSINDTWTFDFKIDTDVTLRKLRKRYC